MPYLILKPVTAKNTNGDSYTHSVGTVVSDWELSDHIKEKIKEGAVWYRTIFEPLTDDEAQHHRVKATAAEGSRFHEGAVLSPPWGDYVGLHPEEIIERMRASKDKAEIDAVKRFERAGMDRPVIMEYTAPVEREPFAGYDEMSVRDILAKLAILDAHSVEECIAYETGHRSRPAITQYEKEIYEPASTEENLQVA